ncbi:hypothetical protein ACOJBO_09425 [Rhizobium beringeri]
MTVAKAAVTAPLDFHQLGDHPCSRERLTEVISSAWLSPPMYPPPYPNISIKILDHPLLESFRWDTTDQIILICRERSAEASGQVVALRDWPIERAHDFCAFGQWPLDYQTISINRHSGTVTFSAGHGGVAPLYLKVSGERIDLSWSIADFYSGMTLR